MTCDTFKTTDGFAIVCNRGKRRYCTHCGRHAGLLCDYPLYGKKLGKTCDAPICEACAKQYGPDRHLCRTHADLVARGEIPPPVGQQGALL